MNGRTSYAEWIALDWGMSALHAWAMTADGPRAHASCAPPADPGAEAAEAAVLSLVEPWLGAGAMPLFACGSAGAPERWRPVAPTAVPARPIAGPLVPVPTRDRRLDVHVVPGLSQAAPADLSHGAETRVAGFLARNPGWDGILCLPGSHSLWAEVSAGEVVSFRSYMTGELFHALSRHTLLRHALGDGDGWDEDAFADALSAAMSRPEVLAARLFGLHAEALLSGLAPAAATARLWGLLVGIELAGSRPYWLGREVAVIGQPAPAARYREALLAQGLDPPVLDAEQTVLAGLVAARALVA